MLKEWKVAVIGKIISIVMFQVKLENLKGIK